MLQKLVKQDKEVLKSGDNGEFNTCVHYEPQLLVEIFCFELENKEKIFQRNYTRTLQTNPPFVYDYTIHMKKCGFVGFFSLHMMLH